MVKKFTLALLFALLSVGALAQTGTGPTNSVPYFFGPTVQGFGSVGPCSNGQAVVGNTGAAPSCQSVRPVNVSNPTYYIRTDGSDSLCNGFTDASSASAPNCALATWQAASTAISQIDINSGTITIRAGAEAGVKTWTGPCIYFYPMTGGGKIVVTGNGANTVINGTAGAFCLQDTGQTNVSFGNLTIKSVGGYGSIAVYGKSTIVFEVTGGPIFDTAGLAHIWVHDNQANAWILSTTYTIIGGANWHIVSQDNGHIFYENNVVTLTGTPAFPGTGGVPGGFAWAGSGGTIQITSATFNGAATGPKFIAQGGGIITNDTTNLSLLPGSTPGAACSGGMYIATPLKMNVPCGNWTPTDNSGAGLAFSSVVAKYFTPAGGMVQVTMLLQYPVTVSGANAAIAGLPFSNANGAVIACNAVAGNALKIAFVASNAATMTFFTPAGVQVINSDLSNSFVQLNCSYPML